MTILDQYRGLPKGIYALFCVQVINRFGDFVFPFLSLLLSEKLKLSFAATGAVVMIASLVGVPASLIGGKLSDQISRKKTYLFGQTLAAVLVLVCGFIQSAPVIVSLLILSAFFNGFVRPSIAAIMADMVPAEKRQTAASLLYLGINVGVSLGPMVAGFLFNHYLSLLFIGDAATSFIAVGIVIIFIGETRPVYGEKKAESVYEQEEQGNLLQALLKRPQILLFLLINLIYQFVYRQSTFSLPMTMNRVFGGKGSERYGFLMSVNAITVICLTLFVVSVTKKYRTLVNMTIAGVFYAIGFGMIGLIGGSYPLFIFSTILWTIGEIISATNNGVYIADNSPQNFRARFSALSNLTSALGAALGSFILGNYMDCYGIHAAWNLILTLASIGACLMLLLQAYNLKSEKEQKSQIERMP